MGEQRKPRLQEMFEYLHQNPEMSNEEVNTTAFLKKVIEESGIKVKTFDDLTGLVVDVGSGGPVVALRADIDAVYQEVDGEWRPNHSCGHDAHMTMVLGVLFKLLERKSLDRTYRFIFQPAEEKGTGALALIEKGVVDDVDILFGMHLRPIQELRAGEFAPAIQHGAARFINGTIRGEDAHGARPHLTANSIQVGMDLFQQLNSMQINPMHPYSAKLTTFHAGGKSPNIIPGSATFSIDVRAQTNETMEEVIAHIERFRSSLETLHNVQIELTTSANVAAAVISTQAEQALSEAIVTTVGQESLKPRLVTTGGDDFHFYTIKNPELKATMLGVGCDLSPGLHHPHMTFDHKQMEPAIKILTEAMTTVDI
ncbi:M20 peptidase aminoacylase family protein [Geomicrobium sediminis]|uniref:Amidohydrolase n=1 Tax=Geomicrobium sediminis TaxID=1347788 RepID=A0ABS2PCM8_9BACL|nr:M20 peptidase aminoacylase family protein [Geomicrobium sediminis]MBM7633183.1 amidohydrolase [Geomicrobium sediminis]